LVLSSWFALGFGLLAIASSTGGAVGAVWIVVGIILGMVVVLVAWRQDRDGVVPHPDRG
jgi:hypothetical protein